MLLGKWYFLSSVNSSAWNSHVFSQVLCWLTTVFSAPSSLDVSFALAGIGKVLLITAVNFKWSQFYHFTTLLLDLVCVQHLLWQITELFSNKHPCMNSAAWTVFCNSHSCTVLFLTTYSASTSPLYSPASDVVSLSSGDLPCCQWGSWVGPPEAGRPQCQSLKGG